MKIRHQYWLESFLENCRLRGMSSHTLINYGADLKKFIRWYELAHPQTLDKIGSDSIGSYKLFLTHGGQIVRTRRWYHRLWPWHRQVFGVLHQRPMAVSSRRRHLSAIKNFFEFLKQKHEDRDGRFKINPVKTKLHAIRLKDVDVEHTMVLTPLDWERVNQATWALKERLMIHLLYYGGFRLSELAMLRYQNFDEFTRTIRFTRKGGSIHTLHVQKPHVIFDLLNSYRKLHAHKGDYLFCNRQGRPRRLRALYARIKKILKRADFKKTLPTFISQRLRHLLYMESRDLLFVRDYLNHRDAKVTQSYIDMPTVLAHKTARQSSIKPELIGNTSYQEYHCQ